MNILKIVAALIGAYALFVTMSYLLMRLIFPKIQVDDIDDIKPVRREMRKVRPSVRRQKNLAY
jgi:hypothetical protein